MCVTLLLALTVTMVSPHLARLGLNSRKQMERVHALAITTGVLHPLVVSVADHTVTRPPVYLGVHVTLVILRTVALSANPASFVTPRICVAPASEVTIA
jgi:hypothetical protein